MAESRIVVITGMHRSGTSLIASMLQQAGVRIGDELLGGNEGNPRGYFEDKEFFALHERILYRLGESVMVRDSADFGGPDASEKSLAEKLIAERQQQPIWGWKDPRTALFLDFWDGLLDDARYVFIYRHPVDVLLSLLRRGVDFDVLAEPFVGLEAWASYNRRILEFSRQHRDRCLLVDLYGVTSDCAAFGACVQAKLGLEHASTGFEGLYFKSELRRVTGWPLIDSILRRIDPSSVMLYERLATEADISGEVPTGAPTPRGVDRLEHLTAHLVAEGATRESISGPVLSLLLALLVPAIAEPVHSREPLVAYMRRQARRLSELQDELDERTQWMRELERRRETAEQKLLSLQQEFDERTLWALRLVNQVAKVEADKSVLQAELDQKQQQIVTLEENLADRDERLLEIGARLSASVI